MCSWEKRWPQVGGGVRTVKVDTSEGLMAADVAGLVLL